MIRTIGVVVPACNEAQSIGACLSALAEARGRLASSSARVHVRTVVVLDRCIDATADIAATHPHVECVVCDAGQVGAARNAGVRHLLDGASTDQSQTWIANTDADSVVPRDWLVEMREFAERGADLVLGTVLPQPGLPAPIGDAWHARHELREDHPHVHGANFGIRADVYTRLGGWPDVRSGEDVLLAQRALATGQLRIARPSTIAVLTSTRLRGRAPRGFSSYLRGLALDSV